MRTLDEILSVLPVWQRDAIEALGIVIRQQVQAAIAADRESQRERSAELSQLADDAAERTAGYLREALKEPAIKQAVHQRSDLTSQDWLGFQPKPIPMGQWSPCVEGVPCNVCGRE